MLLNYLQEKPRITSRERTQHGNRYGKGKMKNQDRLEPQERWETPKEN